MVEILLRTNSLQLDRITLVLNVSEGQVPHLLNLYHLLGFEPLLQLVTNAFYFSHLLWLWRGARWEAKREPRFTGWSTDLAPQMQIQYKVKHKYK